VHRKGYTKFGDWLTDVNESFLKNQSTIFKFWVWNSNSSVMFCETLKLYIMLDLLLLVLTNINLIF